MLCGALWYALVEYLTYEAGFGSENVTVLELYVSAWERQRHLYILTAEEATQQSHDRLERAKWLQ